MEQLCTHNHYTHHSFSVKVKCCYCGVKKVQLKCIKIILVDCNEAEIKYALDEKLTRTVKY